MIAPRLSAAASPAGSVPARAIPHQAARVVRAAAPECGGQPGAAVSESARCDTPAARTAIVLAATALGIPIDAVLADHRCSAPVATARHVAMYLAHVELGLPQAEVARAFQRDRSTVAHACRRVEDMRDRPAFDETLARLAASARFAVRS